MTSAELALLSTLLDEAQDLPFAERDAWMVALQGDAAALVPTLRALLSPSALKKAADLFDRGPAFTPLAEGCAAAAFEGGHAVGPYRLLRLIGEGGMGEVWLAERSDGQLKRQVALKLPVLGLRRNVLMQRFARERDIVGALAHPHIARLYDAGLADDGQPYLALEYVEGQAITAYCAAQRLDVRARVRLLLQVMDAVQYAHAHLVIHRDLKPGNVLVTAEAQALLLDFGIAKLLQDDEAEAGETELTQLGGRALTPAYAAPEQVSGVPVSTATDVWALGVLLYELLARRRPFEGAGRALEQAVLTQEPPRPRELPADLVTVALKALKKAPDERYASVDAMAEDLRRWLEGLPVQAQPDSAGYRLRRFVGRHKVGVGVAAGVLTAVLLSSAVALQQALVAREQTRMAQAEATTAAAALRFLEGIFRANSGDQADPVTSRRRTAKELLDAGAARIQKELDDAPQVKLRVLKTLATMYSDMAQMDEAANLHGQRAALAATVEGLHSSVRIEALSEQASELISAGRLDEAARLLDHSSGDAARAALTPEARLAWLLARARLARSTASEQCIELAREAVTMLRQRPPSAPLPVTLDLLGACLYGAGRYADALAPLRESLALGTQPASISTTTLSGTYTWLGRAHWRLGQTVEAERAFRAAVDAAARYHGENSTSRMVAELNMGQFLEGHDRVREAFRAFESAVSILRGQPGSADKDGFVLPAYVSAAGVYNRMGRLQEVHVLLNEAAAAAERQRPVIGFAMRYQLRLADLHMETGTDDQALVALDRAREIIEASNGELANSAPDEASARAFLELRRRRPQAVTDAFDWMRKVQGPGAESSQKPGRFAPQFACWASAAGSARVEALRACEAALVAMPPAPHGAVTQARVRWALGRVLLDGGRPAEAAKVLRDGVVGLDTVLDPERSTQLIDLLAALAQAAQANGDARAAAAWRARVQRIAANQLRLSPHYTNGMRKMGTVRANEPAAIGPGHQATRP